MGIGDGDNNQSTRPRRAAAAATQEADPAYLWNETSPLSPESPQKPTRAEITHETLPVTDASNTNASSPITKKDIIASLDALTTSVNAVHQKLDKSRHAQLCLIKRDQRNSNRLQLLESMLSDAPNRGIGPASTRTANPLREPIGNLSQFEEVNNLLREPAFHQQMASYLRCFSGRDTEDFARRIYTTIFEDSIAAAVNFQGRKNKAALGSSILYGPIKGEWSRFYVKVYFFRFID
ncbi:unnamed protein product [Dibothriocephalus latus]|uniref:Uncharacterized protein n=1 Tax=Dibothriocephalus latus TaxID=60516 RepID=A0A3P6U464_DIBLA|nr:unnamed protein product [Dibothriocephalus latus]